MLEFDLMELARRHNSKRMQKGEALVEMEQKSQWLAYWLEYNFQVNIYI